ncbi:MAG: hypothetical protein INR71_14820 [Terriglobus roseus]|nr:hypothetical protein [Terriglobus roseus]
MNDEYTLTTDLSYHLSTRFQRPESSIAVTIQHSACLCLGGSFQPAYLLTVTALPSLISPATNKRNAALMQSFMSDVLSVSPDRGIIRFAPIPEEDMAINGRTILAEIEKLEKQQADENKSAVSRAMTKGSRRSLILRKQKSQELARKASTKTLTSPHDAALNGSAAPTPTPVSPHLDATAAASGASRKSPYSEPEPFDTSSANLLVNGVGHVVNHHHHHLPDTSPVDSKIGRSDTVVDKRPVSRNSNKQLPILPKDMPQIPPPPPIPDDDAKSRKVSKRKSIISIFRSRSNA